MFQIIILLVLFHCFRLHSMAIFHANRKLNLTIMCNESKFNDACKCTCELIQLRGRNFWKYSMPCHGILLLYSFSIWQILCDVVEYSTTSCAWVFGINNSLLILNMGLANKVVEYNIIWGFKDQKKGCISSTLVQTIFQMSRALGQKL